ncbi:hypothetical protein [Nitrospina gracilis]|uniref:hypothetical protein n=1 Tax=Nitrospina gracilis TaxID=35801 RepID=UPI001F333B81|nr:hypothetical protein [Nitrospina gracilis]MCF8719814.1 hypothetical protein [Nitrospina gracilis Nb-211]
MENFSGSFWGSFLGFCFALVLFFFQEVFRDKRKEKNIRKNLERELVFNVKLLEEFEKEIESAINASNANNEINVYLKLSLFRWFFLNKFYEEGMVGKYLDDDDILNIVDLMPRYTIQSENYVNNISVQRNSNTIEHSEFQRKFSYEKGEIHKNKKTLQKVLQKIKI